MTDRGTEPARAVLADAPSRARRPGLEVLLVLGLSLGQSAVYSAVSLADSLSRGPLKGQSTQLNGQLNDRIVFDLVYQVLGIAFPFVPVLLALYLLGPGGGRRIGLDRRRPRLDLGLGLPLALAIGVPGLALYFGARALGLNLAVETSGIAGVWYAVPVLVLRAALAALEEEVIMIGYLFTRLRELRWAPWAVILTSALIRGSYHLYQGFGGFVGNAIMGIVLGLLYRRFGRVGPLVVAHFVLDLVSFVGYDLLQAFAPGLLRL